MISKRLTYLFIIALVFLGNLLLTTVNVAQDGTTPVAEGKEIGCPINYSMYYIINVMTFSPDGRFLAAEYGRMKVKLWNVKTGELIHTFDNDGYKINYVQFSPDGKLLGVSGGCPPRLDHSPCSERQLRFWSVKTGRLIRGFDTTPPRAEMEGTFSFSLDMKYVAIMEGDQIVISDWRTKKEINRIPVRDDIFSFSSDGRYIVAPDRFPNNVIVWDVRTAKIYKKMDATELWKGKWVDFFSMSYSPDDKFIYVGKCEGTPGRKNPEIIVFNSFSGKIIRRIPGYNAFSSSSKGILAAINSLGGEHPARLITILDLDSGKIIRTFKTCDLTPNNYSLSADGKMLAAPGPGNNAINIWDVSTGNLIKVLEN